MVVTLAPSRSFSATAQLNAARPSTITVQAPQSLLSQPYLVPVRLEASRSAHSSGMSASSRYSIASPLSVIFAIGARLARRARRCQDEAYAAGHDKARLCDRLCRSGAGRAHSRGLPPRSRLGQVGVAAAARAFRPGAALDRPRLSG